MPTPRELEEKLWKALESDRTVMLGLNGIDDGHVRPMTAMIEANQSPIWFFTAMDSGIVLKLGESDRAIATFASKGHDIFATMHGRLSLDNDPATISRLWNPFIAAWYEGGKNAPKLALLRFDADEAQIWENANSAIAGLKLLMGSDPKKDYKEKVAHVSLN